MKAYVLNGYGEAEKAVIADMPMPVVGADDVLIEVKAAGLNPVDYKIRQGKLKMIMTLKLPVILGNECAGIVRETGANVSGFKVGERVFFRGEKSRMGCFADELAVQPGMRILITGGAGGVGLFAIQLAKLMGAHVTTTASPRGAPIVKANGADDIIDYTKGDFAKNLADMDGVFDLIGGETLNRCFAITKKGGKVVSIAGAPEPLTASKDLGLSIFMQVLFWFVSRNVRALASNAGVTYRSFFMHPSAEDLAYLSGLIDANSLTVTLDRSLPFAKIGEAFAHLEAGHAKGKVVVTF
jgi:NADPH:quinone reductase-like Zn-dependent oxidoreductase